MTAFTSAHFCLNALVLLFTFQVSLFPLPEPYRHQKRRHFWGMCVGEVGRHLSSTQDMPFCSFILFLPVNTNAAESWSFFRCSSSTSHPWDVVGLSLSCSQGLRSGAVLLMLGSPADKWLASGCKCCDALICECALLPQEVSLVCVAGQHCSIGDPHPMGTLNNTCKLPTSNLWGLCMAATPWHTTGRILLKP